MEPNRFTAFLSASKNIYCWACVSLRRLCVSSFRVCRCECKPRSVSAPVLMTAGLAGGHKCMTIGGPCGWPYQSQPVTLQLAEACFLYTQTHTLWLRYVRVHGSHLHQYICIFWAALCGSVGGFNRHKLWANPVPWRHVGLKWFVTNASVTSKMNQITIV